MRRPREEPSMTDKFKLDMTMMYAFHDALRRDLQLVAQMTTRSEGWEVFERFLHAHHVAEDAALGPLLEAIDDALDRGESAPAARADLATRLEQHLTHEEEAALPVIDRTLNEEQWLQFGEASAARIG